MSSKFTGKAGMGGSNDHEYVYDWEKHHVKPVRSIRAMVESMVFYALSILAIGAMLYYMLAH